MNPLTIIFLLSTVVVGAVAAYLYTKFQKAKDEAKSKVSELEAIEKASEIAKKRIAEAEEKAANIEKEAEKTEAGLKSKLGEQEKQLDKREKKLIDRSTNLDKRFDELEGKEKRIEDEREKVKAKSEELSGKLESIAGLTKAEAEELLKKQTDKELGDWKGKRIKETEQRIKEDADEITKNILIEVMSHSAVDYVSETTSTTVTIDDESLKSRIIGKAGRNIRAFEKLTGVDVIIDEAPNEVTISCFDPIRREVAAIVLKKLLKTGKINPASIEESVEKVKKDLLIEIKKTGEELAFECGFNDLPNEIIMLLGRFKYRFSYGQNLGKHTLEMVKIGEAIALELGADVRLTKLACLLHDLGKVTPQEGKQHHHISAEIAMKHFKDEKLENAIIAHHFDVDAKSVEAEIVRIADAISGARPGARRDSYEDYIKRVRALEDIANKHTGVQQAYAIQAGREVRVLVDPKKVSDENSDVMAHTIAKEIEDTQQYPGIIKVVVIREYRKIEEAK